MTDLDALHPEPLGDVAEKSTTLNREPEHPFELVAKEFPRRPPLALG